MTDCCYSQTVQNFRFQVASILRQAGQDSIRLVIARPVDPSSPQYGVRKFWSVHSNVTHPLHTYICRIFAIEFRKQEPIRRL
jgi:hypothetical protein